ncbi:hypothetical protein D3C76_1185150 [compost metagenome]
MISNQKLHEFEKYQEMRLINIFEEGLNIGKCGLTCRNILAVLDKKVPLNNSVIVSGIYAPLVGTKAAKKGGHCWIYCGDGQIIDTTLMISFNSNDSKVSELFAYPNSKDTKKYSHEASRWFSEHERYDIEIDNIKGSEEYENKYRDSIMTVR